MKMWINAKDNKPPADKVLNWYYSVKTGQSVMGYTTEWGSYDLNGDFIKYSYWQPVAQPVAPVINVYEDVNKSALMQL
jgi:hypothetical protein